MTTSVTETLSETKEPQATRGTRVARKARTGATRWQRGTTILSR